MENNTSAPPPPPPLSEEQYTNIAKRIEYIGQMLDTSRRGFSGGRDVEEAKRLLLKSRRQLEDLVKEVASAEKTALLMKGT